MRENNAIEVSTGNVRTVVDSVQKNPLGAVYHDDANGAKYRYVQFSVTALPAIQDTPAAVWWVDSKKTKVTATLSEAYGGHANSVAGLLMPNSADVTGLTTATLKDKFVFICVAGVVTGVDSGADSAGDALVASPADWTTTSGLVKVDLATAPTHKPVGFAYAATKEAIDVCVESL